MRSVFAAVAVSFVVGGCVDQDLFVRQNVSFTLPLLKSCRKFSSCFSKFHLLPVLCLLVVSRVEQHANQYGMARVAVEEKSLLPFWQRDRSVRVPRSLRVSDAQLSFRSVRRFPCRLRDFLPGAALRAKMVWWLVLVQGYMVYGILAFALT